MSLPPEKIGDKGQRYAISYILPDGNEFRIGWATTSDAWATLGDSWPKLKGASRKVVDRWALMGTPEQVEAIEKVIENQRQGKPSYD